MKKIILPAICAVMIFAAGCGNSDNKSAEATSVSTPAETNDTPISENNLTHDMTMLTDMGFSNSYATEDGYYYVSEPINEESSNKTIMYVDYETCQEIYLCNNPNCQHDSEECPAFLSDELTLNQSYLFGDGDYLYLASTPLDDAGSKTITIGGDDNEGIMFSSGNDTPPVIYKMNLDGTSREVFAEFDNGTVLEPTFMGDGENIYAITKKVSEQTEGNETTYEGYDRELVSIDSNGNITKLFELDIDAEILGCYEGGIIVEYTDYGNGLKRADIGDDYKEVLKNAICTVVKKSIVDGNEEEIGKFTGVSSYSTIVSDSVLYVSSIEDKLVYSLNLLTGDKKTILDGKEIVLDKIVDDTLICNLNTTDEE